MAAQVREIWLSSEDTGAWGLDLGTSIPALLDRLTDELPAQGHAVLRLGMTNPPYILQHLPAIAKAGPGSPAEWGASFVPSCSCVVLGTRRWRWQSA